MASSAPVQAVLDFPKFNAVVKDSLALKYVGGSEECLTYVSDAFEALGRLFVDDTPHIFPLFNICEDSDLVNIKNQEVFISSVFIVICYSLYRS